MRQSQTWDSDPDVVPEVKPCAFSQKEQKQGQSGFAGLRPQS